MGLAALDMSVSLDGCIAGPNDTIEQPGGERFSLHDWFGDPDDPRGSETDLRELAEVMQAGAVLSGSRTAQQTHHWGGDHHGMGVPIYVVSRREPPPEVAGMPLVHYVTDVVDAIAQAKAASGDRHVHMIGSAWVPTALAAGAIDELRLHHVPLLMGGGRRIVDVLPAPIGLEIVRVETSPKATHVRYRVLG
ncbi:dihydrofolate reductase family protein [Agrococcus carbonis]|uniref:Dihydrofolate reductase n=1 Tax=Agrococcus carbonis TaxID=684552 RepID=A0A1H1NAV8_9MICO|nr:dihydrofolate reductase family protein [Agrococcus carbonis]SDR96092.1 Dihydrofolate reductase [Agrococcus carbonis]